MAKLIQGAILEVRTLPFLSTTTHPVHNDAQRVVAGLAPENTGSSKMAVVPARTATGKVMLLTQTCDLQERRTKNGDALVLVAPIVKLAGDQLREASRLAQPKFVPAPWLEDEAFADVGQATSVDRSVVAFSQVICLPPEAERRRLAYLLGRPFSRAAIPNDVVDALRPIQKIANGNHASVRRIFDEAVEMIRVLPDEEYSADQEPSVNVILLIDPDWLPDVPAGDLKQTLSKEPERVADLLVAAYDSEAADRDPLLRRLWSEFMNRIQARLESRAASLPVGRISLTASTHLLPQTYSDSDELDLGHLSLEE